MPNLYTSDGEREQAAQDGLSVWDEVQQIAEEIELKLHLASMEARDRWQVLEPRLTEIRTELERSGERAALALRKKLAALRAALRTLRSDIPDGGSGR